MKNTVIIFIAVAASLLVFYLVAQRAIRYQAIDACLHTGEAKFKNVNNQDVTVPDSYWYDFCVKEKGLK